MAPQSRPAVEPRHVALVLEASGTLGVGSMQSQICGQNSPDQKSPCELVVKSAAAVQGVGSLMQISPDAQPTEDRRFERWLSGRLHAAHDAALYEPVPDELMQLVQMFSVGALPGLPAENATDAPSRQIHRSTRAF